MPPSHLFPYAYADQGVHLKWELTIRFAYNFFISQPIFFELKIKIGVAEAFALIRWYSIPEAKRGCQINQTIGIYR